MDTVELVGRLLIALAVVLGAIWLIAKKARGAARQKLRSDKLIDVLGRQSLTRGSSVAVVRVADQALIVGVTDTNVRVLGEIDLDAAAAHLAAADPTTRLKVADAGTSEIAEYDAVLAKRRLAPDPSGAVRPAPAAAAAMAAAPAMAAGAAPAVARAVGAPAGKLAGSALSPATWKQTIDALRDMTTRKG